MSGPRFLDLHEPPPCDDDACTCDHKGQCLACIEAADNYDLPDDYEPRSGGPDLYPGRQQMKDAGRRTP